LLIGGSLAGGSSAWRQVYRALEHGAAKAACKDLATVRAFPKDIQDFASLFVQMQEKRHLADYDPLAVFFKSEVTQDIAEVEEVIARFVKTAAPERRAFAAYVLFRRRS
jgi:hypothetical protein